MNNQHDQIEVRDLRNGDWLWTHKQVLFSPLPDSAYRVYSALAAYAGNQDQRSWPATATLASKIGSSKSTVIRSLKILKDSGLIEVEIRQGTSSVYTLLPCKEVNLAPIKKAKSIHNVLIKFFHDTAQKTRGVKVLFSPADLKRMKDVLAFDIFNQTQIEQLMLYYLASPKFRTFTPSLTSMFSNGIFTAIQNTMINDPKFWKDIENYSLQLRPTAVKLFDAGPPQVERIAMSSMKQMIERFASFKQPVP